MVLGIFFCAFSAYFGVYFWTIGRIAIAIGGGGNKSKNLRVNFLKNVQKSTFDDMNGPRRTVGQQI